MIRQCLIVLPACLIALVACEASLPDGARGNGPAPRAASAPAAPSASPEDIAAERQDEADRRAAPGASAEGRNARCLIESGAERYEGPCLFNAERGGSFFVRRADGAVLLGEITDVSVVLTGRGRAEVRGLTTGGINSRWGPALRSDEDKACWVAEDGYFRVCAYG